jgi:hypothetical protein
MTKRCDFELKAQSTKHEHKAATKKLGSGQSRQILAALLSLSPNSRLAIGCGSAFGVQLMRE